MWPWDPSVSSVLVARRYDDDASLLHALAAVAARAR